MKKTSYGLFCILTITACQSNVSRTSEPTASKKSDTIVLFSREAMQLKLDSLSKVNKGKIVTIHKSSWFKAKTYSFKFYRDTTTLWPIKLITLKEGDRVKVIGEFPVNNDRVKVSKNGKIGYVSYYDIYELQYLMFKDSEYN